MVALVDKQRKGIPCPKGKYVCVINLTPLCHESLGMRDTMCGNWRILLSLEKNFVKTAHNSIYCVDFTEFLRKNDKSDFLQFPHCVKEYLP